MKEDETWAALIAGMNAVGCNVTIDQRDSSGWSLRIVADDDSFIARLHYTPDDSPLLALVRAACTVMREQKRRLAELEKELIEWRSSSR